MKVDSASKTELVERYKTEILNFAKMNPKSAPVNASKILTPDRVSITDIGKLLCELSANGGSDASELIKGIVQEGQADNLGYFLQAFYAVYGADYSNSLIVYDRLGYPEYTEEYKALRRYLYSFASYIEDASGENGLEDRFIKKMKKIIKKFMAYFLGNGSETEGDSQKDMKQGKEET